MITSRKVGARPGATGEGGASRPASLVALVVVLLLGPGLHAQLPSVGCASGSAGAARDSAVLDSAAARGRLAVEGFLAPECFPEASPPLPPSHWSVRAAVRAEALGLAPGFYPPQRAVPRAAVAAALRQAALAAAQGDPERAAITTAWLWRFATEFPEYRSSDAPTGAVLAPLGGYAVVGAEDLRGRLEPAAALFESHVEPQAVGDRSGATARTAAGALLGSRLSVFGEARAAGRTVDLPRWDVTLGMGPVAASVGEEYVGYGPARGGGIVLGANAPLVRVQVQTPRPVVLPGPLRHLGQANFHTFLTRLTEPRHAGDPWFWGAHLGVQPHPRLSIGINRASIFGGDSITTPTTPGNVGRMLLGTLSRDFENQIVSMEFRYRMPTERLLPLTVYLEWGAEDAAGSWWAVPGISVGGYVPALPAFPEVAAGVEYTHFDVFCCGNPPWYLHNAHPGSWVAGGEPLGHGLGGEGREALAYASADLWDARLRVESRAFLRDRSDRGYHTFHRAGNLFAPLRSGGSRGAELNAALRLFPRAELSLYFLREAGDGWREQALRAEASYLF